MLKVIAVSMWSIGILLHMVSLFPFPKGKDTTTLKLDAMWLCCLGTIIWLILLDAAGAS